MPRKFSSRGRGGERGKDSAGGADSGKAVEAAGPGAGFAAIGQGGGFAAASGGRRRAHSLPARGGDAGLVELAQSALDDYVKRVSKDSDSNAGAGAGTDGGRPGEPSAARTVTSRSERTPEGSHASKGSHAARAPTEETPPDSKANTQSSAPSPGDHAGPLDTQGGAGASIDRAARARARLGIEGQGQSTGWKALRREDEATAYEEAPTMGPASSRPAGHALGARQLRYSPIGTTNYIAPEVLSRQVAHSYEVDLWSLGVIVFELLFGYQPFKNP